MKKKNYFLAHRIAILLCCLPFYCCCHAKESANKATTVKNVDTNNTATPSEEGNTIRLVFTKSGQVVLGGDDVIYSNGQVDIEIENNTEDNLELFDSDFVFRIYGRNDTEQNIRPGSIPPQRKKYLINHKEKYRFSISIERGINKKVELPTGWYVVDLIWRGENVGRQVTIPLFVRIAKKGKEAPPFATPADFGYRSNILGEQEIDSLATQIASKTTQDSISRTVCKSILKMSQGKNEHIENCNTNLTKVKTTSKELQREEVLYFVTIGTAEYMEDLLDSPCYVLATGEINSFFANGDFLISQLPRCDQEIYKMFVSAIVGSECIKRTSDNKNAFYFEYLGERLDAIDAIKRVFDPFMRDEQCLIHLQNNYSDLWRAIEKIRNKEEGWIDLRKGEPAIKYEFKMGLTREHGKISAAKPIWRISGRQVDQ